ncbi:MAG: formylmethanofuran dehydrogenase [Gaiellales bacterium]|nr:formylmethanofuran dehydrogenase [Gaiellales bacterium]
MLSFTEDLEAARRVHGGRHYCHGLVLGVRLARVGCRLLGLEDPAHYRDLMVYAETDRCAADAVSGVTGATLGRRRLKWVDYGKFAATFLDLATGRAVRVWARSDVPHGRPEQDAVEMWAGFTDDELFGWDWVEVEVPVCDLPGRPRCRVRCEACGEEVRDGRHRRVEGRNLCRACAGGAYYSVKRLQRDGASAA